MSTDGWSSAHNEDVSGSGELEGLSDDGTAAHDDDDDNDDGSMPDVFEEFHHKSSQRIRVLLRQTEDKMHQTYIEATTSRSDTDCFGQWALSSCYLRVQGHNGLDASAASAPPPLPTSIRPIAVVSSSRLRPAMSMQDFSGQPSMMEVRGISIQRCYHTPTFVSDEEVFATHGILDEPICQHMHHPPSSTQQTLDENKSTFASSGASDDDEGIDLVAPKPCLVQQLHDAMVDRLWKHVMPLHLQPLLRHVLWPFSAPHPMQTRTSRVIYASESTATSTSLEDPPPPSSSSASRLKLVLPRYRNLTNQFIPVLASRDIHRGIKRVTIRPPRYYYYY
ncbi:hypothetical protein, variant [Aphanomyces astaci]|uniref:Uncharacterized protein n=1 Tax=Aphanomyces astaci TaxID=112090 RepID=W4GCJ4_APHAT|nr:hypothetical protein, variant [Aphanomyces astaci]ETV77006.1 hypothetical protein, variant [Aphanomyces astaci]|eukprot:XP_009833312.1 hypothetical protein, variant [Aphanomyces astaci]